MTHTVAFVKVRVKNTNNGMNIPQNPVGSMAEGVSAKNAIEIGLTKTVAIVIEG